MLDRLLPRQFDNARGSRVAWWLLVLVVGFKLIIGLNSMAFTRLVAERADGLPLDSYSRGGTSAVLAFFSLWGLGQTLLAALGILALARYRSMIPLIYLILLIEQVARRLLLWLHPLFPPGTQAGAPWTAIAINVAFVLALLAGLTLSLRAARGQDRPAG